MSPPRHLLILNLKVDRDDGVLGFTTDWINALAALYERVWVLTMHVGTVDVAANVTVLSVGKEKGYSEPRRAWEFYRLLTRLLRDEPIEAAFAHMNHLFALMAAPLLRARRVPLVLWYAHRSVTPGLRLATRCVDRVLTASEHGFRLATPKRRVIGHGIDTERFRPAEAPRAAQPFTVLSVGRVSPIKRLELLLEAIATCRAAHPELPIALRLVGGPLSEEDRRYAERLAEQARSLGIQECVSFVGNVAFRETPAEYARGDCFVNLAPTGAPDKAALEAMSCGLPVVLFNQTFRPMLGPSLGDTWVVEDAAELAERLLTLAAMPLEERRALGVALRAIVEREHGLARLCAIVRDELAQLADPSTALRAPSRS